MNYEYDVVFSFAGEDRAYVAQLVGMVQARGISVFYDDYETANLVGENLYQKLYHTYHDSARLCVIVASSHYLKKDWTMHELRAAQDREFLEKCAYIIPIRLEPNIHLPGIPDTMGYLDAGKQSEREIAYIIRDKVNALKELERAQTENVDDRPPGLNLERIADLPEKVGTLIDTMLGRKNERTFLAQFTEIQAQVLSYGSESAISLIADMHDANFRNAAHPENADGNEMIALYILLLCQVTYDATGVKMNPQDWYKIHFGFDYFQNPKPLHDATNKVVHRLNLPSFLKIE